MYLLPGEEKIHSKENRWLSWESHSTEEYAFPPSWQGNVYFVNCRGPENCLRRLRPLQCRSFPLKPVLLKAETKPPAGLVCRDEDSELGLIYHERNLPYCCPLIEASARLDPAFIRATYTVWKHLIRDPLIYDLVKENI